jgi:hypothetical protein
MSLTALVWNFNLDSKPVCHAVSKALSISKNTAAVVVVVVVVEV